MILCIVTGGIGDEILAMPALRYLHDSIQGHSIEVRLGGWFSRKALFQKILSVPIPVLPLEELYQPEIRIDADWILHMDIRTLRGKIPEWVQARQGVLCFESDESHANAIVIPQEEPFYWQHNFDLAFRLSCELNNPLFSASKLKQERERYRNFPIEPPTREASESVARFCTIAEAGQPVYAITPGGKNPKHKIWPVERFGEVICYLTSKGISVLILGSAEEMELSNRLYDFLRKQPEDLRNSTPGNVRFLTGQVKLAELPYVLQRVELHISNDNGIAQISGALNCEQVVLYRGASSPHCTLGSRDIRLFSGNEFDMSGISVDAVIAAIEALYRGRAGRTENAGETPAIQ